MTTETTDTTDTTSYLGLLRRRPAYRALFIADIVSVTGDWFSLVAISVLAATRADAGAGGMALALVLAAHLLPGALLSPVAGVLADRFDRRHLLIGTNVVEGLVTVAMAAAAFFGEVGLVQLLLLLRSALAAVREPAAGAAMPNLVTPTELPTANALAASAWSTTFVVGMALGGLAAATGPTAALVIDAASFFIAAFLVRALPSLVPTKEATKKETNPAQAWWAAAKLATTNPSVRAAVFGKTPMAFAGGAAWVALNLTSHALPFAGVAATTLGALQALRGVGTGIGPLLIRAILARTGATPRVAHLSALSTFAGTFATTAALVLAADHSTLAVVAIVVGVLVWGTGNGALWVITQTEIQQRSTDAIRGRLLATDGLGFACGMAGSAVVFGAALDHGIPALAVSIAVVGVAVVAWFWIRDLTPQPPLQQVGEGEERALRASE